MFSAEEVQILLLSLRVAFCCVLLSLLPAVLLGWLLARREFPLKIALDGLCHLPLVLPPVVTGYLLLLLFGRRGLFGPVLAVARPPVGLRLEGRGTGLGRGRLSPDAALRAPRD